jgi:hypothetical protein
MSRRQPETYLRNLFEVWDTSARRMIMVTCAPDLELARARSLNTSKLYPQAACRPENMLVTAATAENVSRDIAGSADRFGVCVL